MSKRVFLTLELVDDFRLYMKTHLVQLLKSEQLPYSKPTVLILEAEGVIPEPDKEIVNPNINKEPWRVYTGRTLRKIVERVRKHYEQKGQ